MRIVVAIEPRYYRDVIGEAIRGFKPHAEVTVAAPDEVEEAVRSLEPELVICERPTSWMTRNGSESPCSWVEYRPYEEGSATRINVGGRYRTLQEFELKDLLSVVDEAEEISRARRDSTNP